MSGRGVTAAAGGSRLHELRVRPIADAGVRREVARRLAGRFPAEDPGALPDTLEAVGFVGRLPLSEPEAAALLRELYAAGAPPAAVILLPVELLGAPGRDGGDAEPGFGLFAARGGRFAPTWSWPAFVLGPLWYFRKGLYGKGLVLLVLMAYPLWPLPVTVLLSLALFGYCGVAGNWDHYLFKVKGTQWW